MNQSLRPPFFLGQLYLLRRLYCLGRCLTIATCCFVALTIGVFSACRTGNIPAPKNPAKQKQNVILITLDTVRADHVGAYGYKNGRTPTLDKLAKEGALFEQAYAVAPVTLPTHSTMMTGLYPQHHGVRNNGSFILAEEQITLAEHFRDAGYDTGAVVSALVLDSKFGLDQGFRLYDDDLQQGESQKMFMFRELKAEQTIDKAIALATKTLREPYFLWVHLFDAHADYDPPPPFDVLFLKQPYDGEIAYVDRELGRFVQAIKRDGILGRSIVSVMADHGDSLGEHGETTHGIFIYRATTYIPWIIRASGVAPQRVTALASQVDLAPTLLSLAGVGMSDDKNVGATADGISFGEHLLHGKTLPKRSSIFLESMNPRLHFGWHEIRAIQTLANKYIELPTAEFYNLDSDPHETNNLLTATSQKSPNVASQRVFLSRQLQSAYPVDDIAQMRPRSLDSDTAEMLEALGYVGGVRQVDDKVELPDPKDTAHLWWDQQRCHGLVRKEQRSEAKACLQKLTQDDPGNWTAFLSLANEYRKAKAFNQAEGAIGEVIKRDPSNMRARLSLASIYDDQGRNEEALNVIKEAIKINPKDADPWIVLGDTLQDHNKTQAALEAYSEALKLDETQAKIYVGLGNSFNRLGKLNKASRYLNRATQLDPVNDTAWYNLGVVEEQLNRTDKAIAAYLRATVITPNHAMAYNNLGSLYNKQGRRSEALSAFNNALQVRPNHVEALYNIATLILEDNPKRAVELFTKVTILRPSLIPARYNLAHSLALINKIDRALEQYWWLVKNTPKPIGPLLSIAALEVKRDHRGAAKKALKSAIAMGGKEVKNKIAKDDQLKSVQ